MDSIFKTWKRSRVIYREFLEKYSLKQLNKIPPGFNNNLVWNIGHGIVMQQALIYKLSNRPMYISDRLFNIYKSGTRPAATTSQGEVDELKFLTMSLVEKTEADFADGVFETFVERTTSTGFHLASLRDAFQFNNYHEGLHLGYMLSIRNFV